MAQYRSLSYQAYCVKSAKNILFQVLKVEIDSPKTVFSLQARVYKTLHLEWFCAVNPIYFIQTYPQQIQIQMALFPRELVGVGNHRVSIRVRVRVRVGLRVGLRVELRVGFRVKVRVILRWIRN